jgi:DNA-directed RNA polymerase subunit RPC12/RpoP
MNKEELKQQYDELVSRIETAKIFDGRNKGVDVYVCKKCGKQFYTRYKDKGVTPFTIKCRHCDHGTMMHDQTVTEQIANVMAFEVHNWVRPTFEQLQTLSDGSIEHVLNGGLMLEDELEQKSDMEKTEIKKIQRMAQKLLEQLQGKEASFLFVGDEGNCFTIGGDPTMIAAQILFAMVRYPVVKDIIKKCADNYDSLNEKFGEDVRNLTLEHLIEVNSGN